MIDFVSTTLYNPNGTLYTVPDLLFSPPGEIQYFYERFYTN